tara:strand:- start:11029 stop:11718 length:690 start_codon:yes stop_codon:yes gene_type:complete
MTESTDRGEFDMGDMESSFKEERESSSGVLPPEKMPSAPIGSVSPEIGDQIPDSYSVGTSGSPNTEYAYGNPGAEMKARRKAEKMKAEKMKAEKMNGADLTAETQPKKEEVSAVEVPSSAPYQTNMKPEEIADAIYHFGTDQYNFFVSSALAAGGQWFFPAPRVLMIAKSDYLKVLDFLQIRFKRLYDHEGDGFVGDSAGLLQDPTFGPMMAMSGMFHVEQENIDESAE